MAKRWSFEEDYIVCKFYLGHVDSWKAEMDILMMLLCEYGFADRDRGSARMRVQNYESLHVGKGLSNAAQQSRDIYSAMLNRVNNPQSYRVLRHHLEATSMGSLIKTPSDLSCYLHVQAPSGDNFFKMFWSFFRASGLTDPEVYNSCNMGRDTFWRIANNKNEGINKKTVIQLCFGLKLSYANSLALLEAAGYTLSKGITFDHVIATYLQSEIYDVNDVNLTLQEEGVPSSLYLLQKNRRSSKEN